MEIKQFQDVLTVYWAVKIQAPPTALIFFLGSSGKETSLHNDRLLGESSLAQHLKVPSSGAINNWGLVCLISIFGPSLLRNKGPQLVEIDSRLIEVGVVRMDMEVPHTNLSKVTRMVLIEVNSVVVLTSSVSATSGVLPVLSDPTMTVGDMSSQLPGLLLSSGHFCLTSLVEVNQAILAWAKKTRKLRGHVS